MMFVRTVNGYMYYPPAGPGTAAAGAPSYPAGASYPSGAAPSGSAGAPLQTLASSTALTPGYSATTSSTVTPQAGGALAPTSPTGGLSSLASGGLASASLNGGLSAFGSGLTSGGALTGGLTAYTAATPLSSLNGGLAAYTPAGTAAALNGLAPAGMTALPAAPAAPLAGAPALGGGLAAMSSTTALMSPLAAGKWMLPGWSPFGLRFPPVSVCVILHNTFVTFSNH